MIWISGECPTNFSLSLHIGRRADGGGDDAAKPLVLPHPRRPSPLCNIAFFLHFYIICQSMYPFTALVGQEEMKLALILNVVDVSIGGVLIMGHRGTGKSTAVRGLASLLPKMPCVKGCTYRCDPTTPHCLDCRTQLQNGRKLPRQTVSVPIVDLPLGATEDRVCGTIDIERALRDGIKAFEPGLLARANRGFLYLDEVNLLEDHLVDLLLDVAASGRNKVEREGISIEHPANFVLIGSGNPEEGELRPQLLDRFGLHVEIKTEQDLERRMEIVERRQAFEFDAMAFCATFASTEMELRRRISRAIKILPDVKLERPLLRRIAQLCSELNVDGHRGELTIARAARALAALSNRKNVAEEDVQRVTLMSLRHRLRRDLLEEAPPDHRVQKLLGKLFADHSTHNEAGRGIDNGVGKSRSTIAAEELKNGADRTINPSGKRPGDSSVSKIRLFDSEDAVNTDEHLKIGSKSKQQDRAAESSTRSGKKTWNAQKGRYTKAGLVRSMGSRVALDATLRAVAASKGLLSDRRSNKTRDIPSPGDLRFKRLTKKAGTLSIFAIDCSGSMALNRIRKAKRIILGSLRQSYVNRDQVAIVSFRGLSAAVVLPPSRSILRARRTLESLPIGGGTPLSAGLACALELAKTARRLGDQTALLLFTDGHANVPLSRNGESAQESRYLIKRELELLASHLKDARIEMAVFATQPTFGGGTEAREIAEQLGCRFVQL